MNSGRRGFILIAVMIVIGAALLVATTVAFMARSEIAGTSSAADAARSRALAWSGAQAVVTLLNEQRDEILVGRSPQLDGQYEIYDAPGELGVVRLLPVAPGGGLLAPEGGKLDLNLATAERLVATGLVDAETAGRIIAQRPASGYQSVASLLDVRGITPELLYGPLDAIAPLDDADAAGDALGGSLAADDQPRGLADVVTVYAFEPNLQRDGRLRINLNVEWSDELGRRVDDRFGDGAGNIIKALMDNGVEFNDDAIIYETVNNFDLEPDEWRDLDALTTIDDEYLGGRLDINTAPVETLVTLPGIDVDTANRIVAARDSLDDEDRSTVAWPAILEIVEAEAYNEIGAMLTTRSWTYRLRLAAGTVDPDEPDAPLVRPVIWEIVVDLSAPRARLAYLRDITLLQVSAALALAAPPEEFDDEDLDDDELDDEDPVEPDDEELDDEETDEEADESDENLFPNPFDEAGDDDSFASNPFALDDVSMDTDMGSDFSLDDADFGPGDDFGPSDDEPGPPPTPLKPSSSGKTKPAKRVGRWTSGS